MLLGFLLDFLFGVLLVDVGATAVGVYALGDYATKDSIILCKSYANESIVWDWGDSPDSFNFQDFIGLSVEEVKQIIPDVQDKQGKFLRTLDYYELNLLFSKEGICTSVEYLRPSDPKWPYKYNGKFPLENCYTESKLLKLKTSKYYPIYIYRLKSFATENAFVCHAELQSLDKSESSP